MDEDIQQLKKDIQAWKKLQSVAMTDEFDQLRNTLVKTVTGKMMLAFTGDSIKTIEDFYKVKGEVVARLQPLQEITGAGEIAEQLEKQLKENYAPEL
jgi:hypothetical protein